MAELKIVNNREVLRPLNVLVSLIHEQLKLAREATKKAGMPYYREVGNLLREAKPQMTLTEFYAWAKRNFNIAKTQAYNYMAFAETVSGSPEIPFRSLEEFERPNRPARVTAPIWHEPVRESVNRVNVERLIQERQDKNKEAKLIHDLGIELINIGYKVLATKLHPDKGGSREAMARLNRVRDILKAVL